MRWPCRKYRPATPSVEEGRAARDHALDRIANIDDRWDEVHTVAKSLRQLRTENHFADQIAAIFTGKGNK